MNNAVQTILLKDFDLTLSQRCYLEQQLERLRDIIPINSSISLSLWTKNNSDYLYGSLRVKTLKRDFVVRNHSSELKTLFGKLQKEMKKEILYWKKQRFPIEGLLRSNQTTQTLKSM